MMVDEGKLAFGLDRIGLILSKGGMESTLTYIWVMDTTWYGYRRGWCNGENGKITYYIYYTLLGGNDR